MAPLKPLTHSSKPFHRIKKFSHIPEFFYLWGIILGGEYDKNSRSSPLTSVKKNI